MVNGANDEGNQQRNPHPHLLQKRLAGEDDDGDDESEEEDSDEDDYDDFDDDDEEEVDDSCPPGCDMALYEKVDPTVELGNTPHWLIIVRGTESWTIL